MVDVPLLRASKVLQKLKLGGDEPIGVNLIIRAIEEPMRWIATNAGHEGSIVVQRVKDMKDDVHEALKAWYLIPGIQRELRNKENKTVADV